MVIAYLMPNQGQAILNQITSRTIVPEAADDSTNPLISGHQVNFDQYYTISLIESGEVTFDGSTSFDNSAIIFDTFSFEADEQLYRMNTD